MTQWDLIIIILLLFIPSDRCDLADECTLSFGSLVTRYTTCNMYYGSRMRNYVFVYVTKQGVLSTIHAEHFHRKR